MKERAGHFYPYFLALAVCSFLLLVAVRPLFAAGPPQTFGYQGTLSSSGVAVTGTKSITFKLYDAPTGGTLLYTEAHPSVSIDSGFFSLTIGSVTPLTSIALNQALYVELVVEGTTMSPRQIVNSVPYAKVAYGALATSTAPTDTTGGMLYYDTTSGKIFLFNDILSSWVDLTATSSQNFTALTSTTTNATSTTFFAALLSATNLTAENLIVGSATTTNATSTNLAISNVLNVAGLTTLSNLLVTGSSTLQNITFVNATGTGATTTSLAVLGVGTTTFGGGINIGASGCFAIAGVCAFGGSPTLTGTGGVGNIAFWNTTNSITSDFSLHFATSSLSLGVGTATPYARLTVWGTTTSAAYKAFEVVNNASTTLFSIYDDGLAVFSATSTFRSTLGVGTDKPGMAFTVLGGISIAAPASNTIFSGKGSSTLLSIAHAHAQSHALDLRNTFTSGAGLTVGNSMNRATNAIGLRGALAFTQATSSSVTWANHPSWDPPSTGLSSFSRFVFGDLDGDGVVDGIAVSYGGGSPHGLRNVGDATSPIWSIDDTLVTGFSFSGTSNAVHTGGGVMVDINDDGLLDMILGHDSDVLVWLNVGTASQPVWQLYGAVISGLNNAGVGAADLDGDGDYDLMVTDAPIAVDAANGSVFGYENTGTVASSTWARKPAWDIVSVWVQTSPTLGDIDADGDYDLLVGNASSASQNKVFAYENTGSTTGALWTPTANFEMPGAVVGAGGRAPTPTFVDINSDGLLDVVIGRGLGLSPQTFENLQGLGGAPVVFSIGNNKVSIGTTTKGAALFVSGNILSTGALQASATALFSQGFISYASSTFAATTSVFGNLGIGTGNPGYPLHVVSATGTELARFENSTGGTACTLSAVTGVLTCTSDERLKKDFIRATSSLDKILQLKPTFYRWKFENEDDPLHPGFIAQEFETVLPNSTKQDARTGLKMISEIDVIPYLVGAVQELKLSLPADGLTFYREKITTKELCVADDAYDVSPVCVTKELLKALIDSQTSAPVQAGGGEDPDEGTTTLSDTEPPVITVMGNNPAVITLGSTYIDPGASVTDNIDQNLGVMISGDTIDTSTTTTYVIRYNAVDSAGNRAAEVTRTVIVTFGE